MWSLYALVGLWLCLSAGATLWVRRFQARVWAPMSTDAQPPVTVIVPVKGAGPHLGPFLNCLLSFDYADYRVLAVVESEADPALPLLRAREAGAGSRLSVLIAGLSQGEGQKVHNLRHALQRLDDRARIVALLDADTRPSPDWLWRLVRPLTREPDIAAVSGHRWIVPDGDDLPSAVVAAANAALIPTPRLWGACWAGTLALRRETLEELRVWERLAGAISDDGIITRLLAEKKLKVLTPGGLLVVSPVRHSWPSAFAFGRRQYQCVRWYMRKVWGAALIVITLPVAGSIAALALSVTGDLVGVAALGFAAALGQVRAQLRARVFQRVLGPTGLELYRRYAWADRGLMPLWAAFHSLCAIASATSNRIRWAGVLYEIRGRNDTQVLGRVAPPAGPPDGTAGQ